MSLNPRTLECGGIHSAQKPEQLPRSSVIDEDMLLGQPHGGVSLRETPRPSLAGSSDVSLNPRTLECGGVHSAQKPERLPRSSVIDEDMLLGQPHGGALEINEMGLVSHRPLTGGHLLRR